MDGDKNINKGVNSNLEQRSLPNARAGHPYKTLLSSEYFPPGTSAECWFEGLEKTGLHFFPDKKQITGIPKNSGSFDVQFNIREYNETAGEVVLSTHALRLLIEEDYNIPIEDVDENAPYWKGDEDVRTISVNFNGRKRLKKDIAAASLRGFHQMEDGKIREDDFCIQYDYATRWYVLAVADGSGKSKYSRQGSKIACRSSVNSCIDQLEAQARDLKRLTVRHSDKIPNHARQKLAGRLHNIISTAVATAYRDIEAEAKNFDCQPEDYATTLLLCICKKFEFGWLIGAFAVGDGAICVFNKDNWSACLLGGIEESSKKCFLTMPEMINPTALEKRIRFTLVDDFSALMLMTNGVSHSKFESEDDMTCFEHWNIMWNDISEQVIFSGKIKNVGEQLLKWLDFWTPGKYDDRTLAVVF